MAAKELIMEDEGNEVSKTVAVLLPEGCEGEDNILRIPREDAILFAASILIQVGIGE